MVKAFTLGSGISGNLNVFTVGINARADSVLNGYLKGLFLSLFNLFINRFYSEGIIVFKVLSVIICIIHIRGNALFVSRIACTLNEARTVIKRALRLNRAEIAELCIALKNRGITRKEACLKRIKADTHNVTLHSYGFIAFAVRYGVNKNKINVLICRSNFICAYGEFFARKNDAFSSVFNSQLNIILSRFRGNITLLVKARLVVTAGKLILLSVSFYTLPRALIIRIIVNRCAVCYKSYIEFFISLLGAA